MSNISQYLAAINSAIYGKDVRGAIHDAIETMNDDTESFKNDLDIFREDITEVTENIDKVVAAWLIEHPEATTTVQDGSITNEKLSSGLKSQWQEIKPLISFITPSYGENDYYPTTYSLAISYDGITYNEINGSSGIVGNGFRGGGDVIITKIGEWYLCVVNSDDDDIDSQICYVATKDFITYSEVKIFTGYNFGTYLVNTYNLTSSFVKGRQWEPSVFVGLDGKYYITISGAYSVDGQYTNTVSENTVTYKRFKQLYAPVEFDEQTQTLVAETGGSIHEFAFPNSVDSVLDVQILAKADNSGYWYLYKDEKRLTSNIAEITALTDTPSDVVTNLLGTSYAENPYMIDYGDYKNIYVTNYEGGNIGREGWIITTTDMDYFESAPYTVNANVMATGRKNRSLHPIVIDDNDVIRKLIANGCVNGFSNAGKNPRTVNDSDMIQVPSISRYFNTEIELSANNLYMVSQNTNIHLTTKWRHDNGLLLFKRTPGTGSHNVTIYYDGGAYTTTLNDAGDVSVFSPSAKQWIEIASSLSQLKSKMISANENFSSSYGTRVKHIRDVLLGVDLFMVAGKYTGESISANGSVVLCTADDFPFTSLIGQNDYRIPVADTNGKIVGAVIVSATSAKTITLKAIEAISQNTILTGDFIFSY